ncbi:MAG: glycerophosphodiester phosphodiesterase family protein [Siphonobacter sp.]
MNTQIKNEFVQTLYLLRKDIVSLRSLTSMDTEVLTRFGKPSVSILLFLISMAMKKSIIVFFIYISTILMSLAQQTLLLTKYTFTDAQPLVWEITGGQTYTLTGADASLFKIKDRNELVFIGKANNRKWYDLTIKSSGRKTDVRIVKDEFNRNGVIAHRGAWKASQTPQNSLASLQEAIKLGCYGSEFDVHMSADLGLFVNHDPHYQEVTIEKTSSDQLKALKLSNGESLPTLEAYLAAGLTQNHTRLILEIKTSIISKERSMALTEKVVKLVQAMKAQGWVDYIAFDYEVCLKVKQLDPYATVTYLNGDKMPEALAADHLNGLDYHFSVIKKHEDWISQAHQHKLTVNVWTANEPDLLQWLLDKKVDYITTNEPESLFKIKAQNTSGNN